MSSLLCCVSSLLLRKMRELSTALPASGCCEQMCSHTGHALWKWNKKEGFSVSEVAIWFSSQLTTVFAWTELYMLTNFYFTLFQIWKNVAFSHLCPRLSEWGIDWKNGFVVLSAIVERVFLSNNTTDSLVMFLINSDCGPSEADWP